MKTALFSSRLTSIVTLLLLQKECTLHTVHTGQAHYVIFQVGLCRKIVTMHGDTCSVEIIPWGTAATATPVSPSVPSARK